MHEVWDLNNTVYRKCLMALIYLVVYLKDSNIKEVSFVCRVGIHSPTIRPVEGTNLHPTPARVGIRPIDSINKDGQSCEHIGFLRLQSY